MYADNKIIIIIKIDDQCFPNSPYFLKSSFY